MKKGFVYLLCRGCLVSQANEKQLDSCQLSMTIRLWLRGWGKDRNTDEGWSTVTGDCWALGENEGRKKHKVIIMDRNFWKPNKALECLSLSVNKEYKHSECCWSVNVKPKCMISPLTCWNCGNRAITVANKQQAQSAVVPGAGELHSSGVTVTLWRNRNLQTSMSMCVLGFPR